MVKSTLLNKGINKWSEVTKAQIMKLKNVYMTLPNW